MWASEGRTVVAGALIALSASGCSQRDPVADLTIPRPPPDASAPTDPGGPIQWIDNGAGVYMFYFDSNWPQSLRNFCSQNPKLAIVDISTAKESGYLVPTKVLVLTTPKEDAEPCKVHEVTFDSDWPGSYRSFVENNEGRIVTASYRGAMRGRYTPGSMVIVSRKAASEENLPGQ